MVLVQACVAPVGDDEADAPGGQSEALYYESTKLWPTNVVAVCWEKTPTAEKTGRAWVRDQVTKAYETETGVQFTGWNKCSSTSKGIRIRVTDERPLVNAAGRDRTECRAAEFGHALSYADEQNRPDTPATCTAAPEGPNGDVRFGTWDLKSIMNRCNPVYNNAGLLSDTDLAGTQALYGLSEYRPTFALADFGAKEGEWSSTKHVRLSGDVNGDKRSDSVGFGNEGV